MQWQQKRRSTNVEDRRGAGGGGGFTGGRRIAVGGGLGGIVLVVLYLIFGGDLSQITQGSGETAAPTAESGSELSTSQKDMGEFVSVVLADVEDVWNEQFKTMGRAYREPKLVLYTGSVESACGYAGSSVGPFYCPGDEKVYIDLEFYRELQDRFGAPGDFAQAYVIAHEVGHHVQNLLGISEKVHAMQQRVSEEEANDLSVRLELQADFFAGVWAYHAQKMRNILEPGDIEEALGAANAIGDDRLQKQARGYVVPDSFTHGTSAQRVRWFRRGFETGDMSQGDTFSAGNL